ncbi:MAG: GNAT family N-acetyltransferase [Candidatus Rifleibacteriota bacterium]
MMIERIDSLSSHNLEIVHQVQSIISGQFPTARVKDIQEIPQRLENQAKAGYHTSLFAAISGHDQVIGFAIVLSFRLPDFHWLEYISAAPGMQGHGIGSLIYRHIQNELRLQGASELFFECCIDDAGAIFDPATLADNIARMRFYERHGARPLINNDYPCPICPDDQDLYYLMFDPLGLPSYGPNRDLTRQVVDRIMKLRYSDLYTEAEIEELCLSFADDPSAVRSPFYQPNQLSQSAPLNTPAHFSYNCSSLMHRS